MRKLMPILLLFLGGVFMRSQAQENEPTVSLSVKNQPLDAIFKSIQSQTRLNIMITEKMLAGTKNVTLDVKNMPLSQALELCLKGTDLTFTIYDGTIIIKKKESKNNSNPGNAVSDKDFSVTGLVMDRNRMPVIGVTVRAEKKNTAVQTDQNGKYQIEADPKDVLAFTHISFKQELVPVKGRNNIDLTMDLVQNTMSEVTISTGYQRIQQKYLTGSVTRLKMDSIMQPGLTTVDKMLEGRVPGLIMMQNSGQAGAAPKLRIRGTSTIMGTREPLWVVDGIVQVDPVPVSANQINDLDFVNLVGNAISGLNPNDIESIDVLKDAAATALYGVRAANGVIVVTTKRGTPGPPTINYNSSISYTRRPRYSDKDVNMMTSQERVDVSKEMFNRQIPVRGILEAYERAIIDYYGGVIDYDTYKNRVSRAEQMNTDWLGAVMQDVISSNNSIGVSGGNQLSRYYASVGYTNERGVIKGEYNKRYTAQIKFDLNTRKLKAQFSILANKNDRRYTPSSVGVLNFAYSTSRAIPIYNEDGSLHYFPVSNNIKTTRRSTFNIINEMDHSGDELNGSSYMATTNLNYELIKGLQLEATLSYGMSNTEQRKWFEENTDAIDRLNGRVDDPVPVTLTIPFGGVLDRRTDRVSNYTMRGQANYSRFADAANKHLINATFGAELSSMKNSSFTQYNTGYYPARGYTFAYIDPAVYPTHALHVASIRPAVTEGLTNLASAYLTASYIYDDRYVFSVNTRNDFSNAFGSRSNERFLPTWGLSARWNIDRDIMGLKWMDQAALRVSYGTQGTMLPGQTPYTIIEKGPYSSLHQTFISSISNYPNPNLQWEKTDAYNAALEFTLFKSKLSGSIGVFYKRTTNVFIQKDVSSVNGLENYAINGGDIENKGIELQFNFIPINQNIGGKNKRFIWRIDPQLGQIVNRLIDNAISKNNNRALPGIQNQVSYNDYLSGNVILNGKAINTFYAYRFKGLNKEGQPVFYGAELENADALAAKYSKLSPEEIVSNVMVIAGKREPVLQGGISNYVAYGSWSLGVNITYSIGNKIRLLQIASGNYGSYRPSSQTNLRKEFVDRWRYPGDELQTKIPGLYSGLISGDGNPVFLRVPGWDIGSDYYQMYDNADVRVVSGDYIKLQSANLRYSCTPELCRLMHLKAATLSLSGSNLFTWANKDLRGQDPTQSGTSPDINLSIRPVYSFSINVSF
ncbi:SusC/RagA family TonB-linked outer membrane protein [Pseudoflavitalea sp. G-6-1-2]|uniref:SusC/RagA family TonB-linked outer membrane protein n=1 Tax=Pseudoflavitalea sp. G-6-1-2 TaxID=2728841 RepID=UPI00146E51BE|nr:SusC/RagA family TonB-linked outer membrane protein [Pseudoflavitalea sp. G-6-1-2]NML19232.1 SusC/RagA family TonB-linked outer membrane protein [Pseudoflavitalea sp. G-6-1-2]